MENQTDREAGERDPTVRAQQHGRRTDEILRPNHPFDIPVSSRRPDR